MIIRERLMAFLLTQLLWELLWRMLNQQFGWLITCSEMCVFSLCLCCPYQIVSSSFFNCHCPKRTNENFRMENKKESLWERQSCWTLSIDRCREGKVWAVFNSEPWAKGHYIVFVLKKEKKKRVCLDSLKAISPSLTSTVEAKRMFLETNIKTLLYHFNFFTFLLSLVKINSIWVNT